MRPVRHRPPGTFVYRRRWAHDFQLPFGAPICKPSNGVAYWEHDFPGSEKVFCLPTREALEATLDRVYAAGYPDSMIIQEFIPGDDSFMRVLTCYSGADARSGSCAWATCSWRAHPPRRRQSRRHHHRARRRGCVKIPALPGGLHFVGFSNFDIKYDQRDGEFKAFEINTRQGRSNYYVTGAGYNLAQGFWWEDRHWSTKAPRPTVTQNRLLWMVVPRRVAYDYTPRRYHQEMRALIQAGAVTNPLRYGPDSALKRKLKLEKNQLGHFVKFKSTTTGRNRAAPGEDAGGTGMEQEQRLGICGDGPPGHPGLYQRILDKTDASRTRSTCPP